MHFIPGAGDYLALYETNKYLGQRIVVEVLHEKQS